MVCTMSARSFQESKGNDVNRGEHHRFRKQRSDDLHSVESQGRNAFLRGQDRSF